MGHKEAPKGPVPMQKELYSVKKMLPAFGTASAGSFVRPAILSIYLMGRKEIPEGPIPGFLISNMSVKNIYKM